MEADTIAGISTDSIIVMTDSATGGSDRGNMGWLRSLPLLSKWGVTDYTFPNSWLGYGSSVTFDEVLNGEDNCFEYSITPGLEFTYHLYGSDSTWSEISEQHLCQYTNQEVENKGKSSTTQKLIRAYNEDQLDKLFLVVDRSDFRLDDADRKKPLTETIENVAEFGYEGAAIYYIQHELPTHYLSLDETLNIWIHEAAVEYATSMDREPTRIADLFEFSEVHPSVRTWDFFEFLASQVTRDDMEHIQATIRPWVEADISVIRDHILNELQKFDFEAEQVRDYRQANTE
ncbi:hypothetical protein [Halorubrum sp. Ea1]|uniref:hypothetical protein n=1 Tax=Halorubrum sp. Ea1 TaxID=1480718 RepID=UPI0011407873|nr:hypothetical protein [Halorubrum sp. Ea1]